MLNKRVKKIKERWRQEYKLYWILFSGQALMTRKSSRTNFPAQTYKQWPQCSWWTCSASLLCTRVYPHPSEKCWQAPGLWFMVTTRASTIMTSVAASLSVVGTGKPSHLFARFSGLWALAIMNGLAGTFLSKNDSSAFRKNIQSTFTRMLSQACK